MKIFVNIILAILRIVIVVKVITILVKTNTNPNDIPIETSVWWILALIFDIWLMNVLNQQTTD
jgi:cytochrome c oxidase assembly factor CtaG